MAWTDEMVEDLKRMWDEGLTTGEIGKRLGVSKNSIVGKVHRLDLTSRPSPIKKKEDNSDASTKEAKEVKSIKETATIKTVAKKEVETSTERSRAEQLSKDARKDCAPEPKKNNGKTMLTDLDNHTCRWPVGDPKDEGFHFCGKKVKIGQTYCDEHSSIAYVKSSKK